MSGNYQLPKHPEYVANISKWQKFRDVFEGGQHFINTYLRPFSRREDTIDFNNRLSMTYNPAFAKAAVVDIRNSIFQRAGDIVRSGGSPSYQKGIIDRKETTMTAFIGQQVLPELLSIGKVGVFVDAPAEAAATLVDTKSPYLYICPAENILSWAGAPVLTTLFISFQEDVLDKRGLIIGTVTRYRLYTLLTEGVQVETFKDDKLKNPTVQILQLKQIPCVIFELNQSLLEEAANYQIALLNMESADIDYALKSNFPFYTEQFDPRTLGQDMLTKEVDGTKRDKEIIVAPTKGRQYGKELERPGFIHPSSEPLKISMEKQQKMKEDIRLLINLSLTQIRPRVESAESKASDQVGLESGLAFIALELMRGEKKIATIWSDFENYSVEDISISYPTTFCVKTDEERRSEAKDLTNLLPLIPSGACRKEAAKQIVKILLGPRISEVLYQKICKEIDESLTVISDITLLTMLLENSIIDLETAGKLFGLPASIVEKAKVDHAERAARIVQAQNSAFENSAAARGVKDLAPSIDGAKIEKKEVGDNTLQPTPIEGRGKKVANG